MVPRPTISSTKAIRRTLRFNTRFIGVPSMDFRTARSTYAADSIASGVPRQEPWDRGGEVVRQTNRVFGRASRVFCERLPRDVVSSHALVHAGPPEAERLGRPRDVPARVFQRFAQTGLFPGRARSFVGRAAMLPDLAGHVLRLQDLGVR